MELMCVLYCIGHNNMYSERSIYIWLGGITSHDTWHELSGSSSEASTNVLCTQ